MMALERVLMQVSVDCMKHRKISVAMCGTIGLEAASWMKTCIMKAGSFSESDAFGSDEKMLREKRMDERLKINANIETHAMEKDKFIPDPDVASARGVVPGDEPYLAGTRVDKGAGVEREMRG